ncbi:YdaU family protein [Pandoraea sputorum]|uniref:YdaU family protein n=1 Tax=Pandoraea sputorum TaxID=93222 RepID=UPI00124057AE|nr:YdaU family protein [Pandoraea sputorum]VVE79366.1 hypothetical protein PSP31120_02197 [Pandoraea sputorum]
MNYYSHHIGDFRSGTVNMKRVERWIYRDLLDVCYDTERPLPLDLDKVCYDIGVTADEERQMVANLLRFKFTKTVDGYVHERCQTEIAAYQANAEKNRENGAKGGRPPKKPKATQSGAEQNPIETQQKPSGFPSGSDSDASGNPSETHWKGNQEPITNNQEVNGSGTSIAVNGDDEIRRLPDAYMPANPAEWATFFGDEHGIEISVSSQHDRRKFVPLATAWMKADITLGRMRQAIERAYAEATEPIAYLPAYVDRVLASSSAPRASPRSADNAAILAGLAGNTFGDEHGHDPSTIDVDARFVG